jgi:hypothetical protein
VQIAALSSTATSSGEVMIDRFVKKVLWLSISLFFASARAEEKDLSDVLFSR